MSTAPGGISGISPSSATALRWAAAAAAHRRGISPHKPDMTIDAGDLLVGILLAHPDADGEGRVLLSHFGLTARDVLPPGYPTLSAEDLGRRARQVGPTVSGIGGEAQRITEAARSLGGSDVHLRHLLGALLTGTSELTPGFQEALAGAGSGLSEVATSYGRWLDTVDPKGELAGRQLRRWLQEQNPRERVGLPGYTSDGIEASRDLIGIGVEADALAYLIASLDVRPPLAIGLFGDWGSGKSFLMRAVQKRIATFGKMVAKEKQTDVPVWRTIKQIEFNAWEYVQGNLWAGLLERIFRELGEVKGSDLVDERRAPIEKQKREQDEAVKASQDRITKLAQKADKQATAVQAAEQEADRARAEAEKSGIDKAETARDQALTAVTALWGEKRAQLIGREGGDLLDALADARGEVRRGRALLGPFWTARTIAWFTLGMLLIPVLAYFLSRMDLPTPVTVFGGLAPALPVITMVLRAGSGWTAKTLTAIEEAEAAVREAAAMAVTEAEGKAEQEKRKLDDLRQQLADAETAKRDAEQRSAALEEELTILTPSRILVEFADERSLDYRRRLGLLSTVRRDLEHLQAELVRNNDKARQGKPPERGMVNRIVLYIDDLDRCPPAKVVEVLEAVHLLLAFELFVVVVAVDSRWLSSALTDQLVALRDATPREGHPTPQNYVEKIFQLPFWVQPLGERMRTQLLRGLLLPSVRAGGDEGSNGQGQGLTVGARENELLAAMLTGPGSQLRLETSPLTMTVEELVFVEALAPLLGATPRRVKRFVNTCQLLLSLPPALSGDIGSPTRREIVCFLAAVHEGLPALSDGLFANVRAKSDATLAEFCGHWPAGGERDRLAAWLTGRGPWNQLRLSQLDVRLDMVDRLGFAPPRLT